MCLVFSRLKLDTKLAEELGQQTAKVAEAQAAELRSDQERGDGEQVRERLPSAQLSVCSALAYVCLRQTQKVSNLM